MAAEAGSFGVSISNAAACIEVLKAMPFADVPRCIRTAWHRELLPFARNVTAAVAGRQMSGNSRRTLVKRTSRSTTSFKRQLKWGCHVAFNQSQRSRAANDGQALDLWP
jgi:hypothetical protein